MKYLLEIHHGIGDIVQYTGLIKSVREYDKDAFIGVVLNKEAYRTLLALDKNVDDIYVIDFSGKKTDLFRSILKIRQRHFDYMVCSIHSRRKSMEFMAIAFGAKKTVGSLLSRLNKISKRYISVSVDRNDHVVKQNNDVLLGLNPQFTLYEPYLVCPPAPPYELKVHSIGLCIGTSIPQKTWPIDRYIAVGEYLESHGYSIVLLGGEKEKSIFDEYMYKNENWVNLLGKTDLIGSASECSKCELVIGGDTGLMHMAAAVGTKTFTLFTCSEPTTHAPYSEKSYYYHISVPCQYCFGTEQMKGCQDYKCVNEITAEIIKEIAYNILRYPGKAEKYRLKLNLG